MFRKVFSHSLLFILANQASAIASIFVLPILTPFLTRFDYGVLGVTMAYVGALVAFKELGLMLIIVNSYFKQPTRFKFIWRWLHGVISMWAVLFALLLGGVVWLAMKNQIPQTILIVTLLVALPYLLFNTTSSIGFRYFQLRKKPLPIVTVALLSTTTIVTINIYTIAHLKMGYLGWFISTAAANCVSFLFYGYHLYIKDNIRPILKLRWRKLKRLLRVSLFTVAGSYTTYLVDTSDRVLMTFFRIDLQEIGLYNVGYTFGNSFSVLQNSIGYVLGPMLLERFAKKSAAAETQVKILIYQWQLFSLTVAFVLSLWLKELYTLLFRNAEFDQAYPLGIIILMSYSTIPMMVGAVQKLYFLEKTGRILWITLGAGGVNVLLNLIFLPLWGVQGAAITTLIALLYMGFAGYFIKSIKAEIVEKYRPLRWLLLTVVLTLLAYGARDFVVVSKSILTLIIVAVALAAFSKLKKMFSAVE